MVLKVKTVLRINTLGKCELFVRYNSTSFVWLPQPRKMFGLPAHTVFLSVLGRLCVGLFLQVRLVVLVRRSRGCFGVFASSNFASAADA